jgi:hypothetical protein
MYYTLWNKECVQNSYCRTDTERGLFKSSLRLRCEDNVETKCAVWDEPAENGLQLPLCGRPWTSDIKWLVQVLPN